VAKSYSAKGSGEISTIIGPDAVFDGRLKVKQSLRVDGRLSGEIASEEAVTIGPEGVIEGDIVAHEVIIGGRVIGKVVCGGKVVLEETAILQGDLKSQRLVVAEGAIFNGLSEMGDQPKMHPPKRIVLEEDEQG